jgi:hypothetical protein
MRGLTAENVRQRRNETAAESALFSAEPRRSMIVRSSFARGAASSITVPGDSF